MTTASKQAGLQWQIDASTVACVHRYFELGCAVEGVRADVALLAGIDPRWLRVQEVLRREQDDVRALAELLEGPDGTLVLEALRERLLHTEPAPVVAALRPSPGVPSATLPERDPWRDAHVAIPVKGRWGPIALLALAVFGAALWGFGAGALMGGGVESSRSTRFSAARPPISIPLPTETFER